MYTNTTDRFKRAVCQLPKFFSAKNFENRLRYDKVTESSKVGTFLRHSVEGRQARADPQTNPTDVAHKAAIVQRRKRG